MILGQAAGVAASLAIRGNQSVQQIDTAALTRTLVDHGAILELQTHPQTTLVTRFRGRWPPPPPK
jgi:hypothetical protein